MQLSSGQFHAGGPPLAKSVLSISYDGAALATQHHILEREGYVVVSALDLRWAKAQCRSGEFDLVVIGYSVPQADIEELVQAFSAASPAPVVIVLRTGERSIRGADSFSVSDEPNAPVAEILYAPPKLPARRISGLPAARSA